METRRLLLFLFVSFGFVLIWQNFIVDKLPNPVQQPAAQQPAEEAQDNVAAEDESATAEADPEDSADEAASNDQTTPAESDDPQAPELVAHDRQEIVLGSDNTDDNYAIQATFSTEGASITSVRLADPRMRDLTNREQQVQVLGNNRTDHQTFSTTLDAIDEQLAKHSPGMRLESVDWAIRETQQDAVTFAYVAPDKSVEVEKTYRIHPLSSSEGGKNEAYHQDAVAYTIDCELVVRNLSKEAQEVRYEILGPCGVVLENIEHTRKYRDLKLEFLEDRSSAVFSASEVQSTWLEERRKLPRASEQEISEQVSEGDEKWIEPIRYAGVDVQFFAALISPVDGRPASEQISDQWIERVWPVLLREERKTTLADITFRMASAPRTLQPTGQDDDSLKHDYSLFVGPKHGALLDPPPFEAKKVLDYGSYFGFIARAMHSVLSFLYGLGMPYWLAIISLTVMVRCCLFPLSRKQAISAARMKELQPKIAELKVKYEGDKEKLAKAQMELWRKYNINPLGGCLPLFFQLPVFIGLYTCLNTAVDLRLSSFLWIDNLAAPDALFRMPIALPFLGQDFNVLPCVNVVLFLVQQKLFMPPPTDEQQEMQHKMMNVMTFVFAFMFWHVPAGLCIYFVASSLWSIGERKLLGSDVLTKNVKLEEPEESDTGRSGKHGKKQKEAQDPNRPKGFMERLMEAAEQAKAQAEQNKGGGGNKGGGKKGGKRR